MKRRIAFSVWILLCIGPQSNGRFHEYGTTESRHFAVGREQSLRREQQGEVIYENMRRLDGEESRRSVKGIREWEDWFSRGFHGGEGSSPGRQMKLRYLNAIEISGVLCRTVAKWWFYYRNAIRINASVRRQRNEDNRNIRKYSALKVCWKKNTIDQPRNPASKNYLQRQSSKPLCKIPFERVTENLWKPLKVQKAWKIWGPL